ncbi:MAG: response regulator [Lachnospiraceae bacterium]|nr:response regulator [Lachnospiraceae bacterium]
MKKAFKSWFGVDVPLDIVNFNISLIYLCVLYLALLGNGVVLHFGRIYYYILGTAVGLTAFAVGYVLQTGKYRRASFGITLLLEAIVLPVIYIIDNRLLSFSLIYFFFPLLITAFIQSGCYRVISYAVFSVFCIASIIFVYLRNVEGGGNPDNVYPIIDVMIPILICTMFTTTATVEALRYYRHESELAEQTRIEADMMERSKDVFLMNMSHEIRTPMNAIMSAGELITARSISADTRQNVQHIMNACRALLSTIDDLLIFSKVENKRILLAESPYELKPLLDDIINMISVRLMNTDVKLYTYIDPNVPRVLFGDMIRLRQVFINLLNNAVKYTSKGHILLRVRMSELGHDRVTLHVDVEDTGIGVKEEMLPTLFDDYVRVADNMNESLKREGTGLGLSIVKAIIREFSGTIDVRSEYNKGSVFTFEVPQKVVDHTPIARVIDHDDIGVIIYDDDRESVRELEFALKDLKIRYVTVDDRDYLNELIEDNVSEYTHIFVSTENSEKVSDILSHYREMVSVVMRDVGDTESETGCDKITKPMSSINVAEYFDESEPGVAETEEELDEEITNNLNRPLVNEARAIVVDDNMTNLIVADKLLRNLGFDVVTADSGSAALGLISNMQFDIIFIDYMMTGMDGVDTLRAIRRMPKDWVAGVPCIVLTADAHDGAKQMLLNAGFDDYLSKPIDVNELEYMIDRYVDKRKLIRKVSDA